MLRSDCVSKRRRAGSPTMMLSSGSRLTTEGHSVLPFGPGIHFGVPVCGSVYATRLLVVPRSIPTILPIFVEYFCKSPRSRRPRLQQFPLNVVDQIPNVRTAIQQFVEPDHDSLAVVVPRVRVERRIPLLCCDLKLLVDLA